MVRGEPKISRGSVHVGRQDPALYNIHRRDRLISPREKQLRPRSDGHDEGPVYVSVGRTDYGFQLYRHYYGCHEPTSGLGQGDFEEDASHISRSYAKRVTAQADHKVCV